MCFSRLKHRGCLLWKQLLSQLYPQQSSKGIFFAGIRIFLLEQNINRFCPHLVVLFFFRVCERWNAFTLVNGFKCDICAWYLWDIWPYPETKIKILYTNTKTYQYQQIYVFTYANTTKKSCKYSNLNSEVNAWEVNVEQCFRSDLIMEHLAANKGSTKSAGFLSLCKKRALL